MKERVLVVEDDPAIAAGLEYQLAAEGFEVFRAATGAGALEIIQSKDPHIILLDLRLPDMNGLDLCRSFRKAGHKAPVLILTALDSESDKVLGLEVGADDYIIKPYTLREVVARVRAALRRAYGEFSTISGSKLCLFGDIRVDFERQLVFKGNTIISLTPTESRILKCMVTNPDRVFSRNDLIRVSSGDGAWACDRRGVDVHILHLREKLENDPQNPCWFITVHGFGYKFTM